ncbi:hypothetical protein [Marinobacter sp. NFXS9]|uniref:hypothetical protein n=1 Tax=Marinobacter sp. NFXS9 TaxID=2818433 RepID=UPI0032DF1726
MKTFDLKPAAIMTTVCAAVGVGIQYATGFYWLTATLLAMVALLVNGLVIFNEDLQPGGLDHQEGVTDTAQARAEQRKANWIQLAIIIFLLVGALWSSI